MGRTYSGVSKNKFIRVFIGWKLERPVILQIIFFPQGIVMSFYGITGQGAIPLTRTDENFTPREIEQKAAELAYFLPVPIENGSSFVSKSDYY
ncbi:hypothetical protein DVH24_027170 [Malus domestica]|uniref:Photosystem I assembly protein Ycf4 n=1 Tax=Malus domestica TaxID=3750 RepID=A0A498IS32_MALDO|nr:hypothetical protein DVH24_027170 [Malus domestica]